MYIIRYNDDNWLCRGHMIAEVTTAAHKGQLSKMSFTTEHADKTEV